MVGMGVSVGSVRLMVGLAVTSLALGGASGSALAANHPRPNPGALWRAYPLGRAGRLATGRPRVATTTPSRSRASSPPSGGRGSFEVG